MRVSLRPAVIADTTAIAEIYAPHAGPGTASYEAVPPDAAEMAMRMAAIQAGGYPYIVAEQDGKVVGYAYASAFRSRAGYRFTVENSVYIAASAQGKGVGRALLEALIDACTKAGYRRMAAVIGDGSNDGSIALHQSLGFTMAARIPGLGVKHGRWLDWVMMVRPLGDSDADAPQPGDQPRRYVP